MAPLNFNYCTRTSYSRTYSGSLLAPSLFIIILMLIFIIIGESAKATPVNSSPVFQTAQPEKTGPDGATSNVDVYGATDINGIAGPAGPIFSDFSTDGTGINFITITAGRLRQ